VVSTFDFKIFQPKTHLAAQVQAVWSAVVSSQGENKIQRWLHSDACSGIVFNLEGDIYLNQVLFSSGVIILPVSKHSQLITLSPGAKLVGLRFHPAISFAIFGMLYQQPTVMKVDDMLSRSIVCLYERLKMTPGHYAKMTIVYKWLYKTIRNSKNLPVSLITALNAIDHQMTPGAIK
jgi:hypothetical protein